MSGIKVAANSARRTPVALDVRFDTEEGVE